MQGYREYQGGQSQYELSQSDSVGRSLLFATSNLTKTSMEMLMAAVYLQRSEHVAWRDAVDAYAGVRPLDGQAGGKVSDCRFRRVVGPVTIMSVDVCRCQERRP
jgi:hypothetical protein